jgi:hypothetical protein
MPKRNLGPTQTLIQCDLSPGLKLLIRQTDHISQSIAKVKMHKAVTSFRSNASMVCTGKTVYYH